MIDGQIEAECLDGQILHDESSGRDSGDDTVRDCQRRIETLEGVSDPALTDDELVAVEADSATASFAADPTTDIGAPDGDLALTTRATG